MSNDLMKGMLDNAVHIGHKREFWSPKMRDYIYGIQNGIHVFDLYKTAAKLEEVKALVKDFSSKGKEIVIVGTKIQASNLVKELAIETNNHYINNTWVPGFLTNFFTIKKRIATYNKLKKDSQTGEFDVLTKKEKAEQLKLLEKLEASYEWVKDLRKVPDMILVVDGHFESLVLKEAAKMGIPAYAILGTTWDIDSCTNFIPANVNSIRSIKFILDELKPSLEKAKVVRDNNRIDRVESREESKRKFDGKKPQKKDFKPRAPKTETTEEVKTEETNA